MIENGVEILLVEDNPNDVELTLHAFKKYNLANRIQVVRDGAEALDYLFATGNYAGRDVNHRPRVILLDLKLPKVDVLEVLRRIKDDPRTKVIPVVVLTSSREEPDLVQAYELGVNAFVVKPVDFHQFTDAIKQIGAFWAILNELPPIHVPPPEKGL